MAKEWAQVAGGLLQGLGTGMVENGRAAREARRAELEHARQKEVIGLQHSNAMARQYDQQQFTAGENKTDRAFRAAEGEKDREARRGLLANTERFTDEQGRMWQRTPQGVEPVTGPDGQQLKGAPPGTKSTRSMAMKDRELVESLRERHTREVTDPANQFAEPREETDWNAVARALREMGRPDLAAMYEGGSAQPAQEGGATTEKMGQNGAKPLKRGDVIDGYAYQGGDPNDPANWKEAR